jgi:hypothetical protein
MAPLVLSQQVDSSTWQGLGLVLTVVGLALSVVVWRRSGAGHGLRAVGWSLVPLAAALTGLLEVAWDILDTLLSWATRLVFSPVVWLGIVVAGVAVVLHVAGGFLVRRSRKAVEPSTRTSAGELTSAPPAATKQKPAKRSKRSDAVVEDQDDIEAILRKHGIS